MIVNVVATPNFQREAKKLIKKYRSLQSELEELIADLEQEPRTGILITVNVYKIRLAVKSKGKGKSGGMRIITYVETELVETEDTTDVYLLSIYDKSDYENISDVFLKDLVEDILFELNEENLDREEEEEIEDLDEKN